METVCQDDLAANAGINQRCRISVGRCISKLLQCGSLNHTDLPLCSIFDSQLGLKREDENV